eukprot:s878_g18.t1
MLVYQKVTILTPNGSTPEIHPPGGSMVLSCHSWLSAAHAMRGSSRKSGPARWSFHGHLNLIVPPNNCSANHRPPGRRNPVARSEQASANVTRGRGTSWRCDTRRTTPSQDTNWAPFDRRRWSVVRRRHPRRSMKQRISKGEKPRDLPGPA